MINRTALLVAAALATTIGTAGSAQRLVPAERTQIQADEILLAGTPVRLRLAEDVTTKGEMLWEGRRFHLEVAEPVMVEGRVLIPAGSMATGEVTRVYNKGSWGRSGKLSVSLVSVDVGARTIRLTGGSGDKGIIGTPGVILSLATFWPLGFVFTGTSAKLPMGTLVMGYIDEDLPLVDGRLAVQSSYVSKAKPRRTPAVYGVDQ